MKKLVFVLFSAQLLLGGNCANENQDLLDTTTTKYEEPHRPRFHFTPDSMWMNDPNGMVYYEGEYHLFYQYYPDSTVWGPMHWGHAVSQDLIHWEHLPIGLYPDSLGFIFSGSAVVDWENTSGLGEGDRPPLIAIFTHSNPKIEKAGGNDFQYQSIAFSLDRGRTWTKYEGNPVLPNPGIRDFRDPKVFWHEASKRWVMIFAAWDRVRLYHSPNLIDWTFTSEFGADAGSHGGVWECPDLFELPVDGDPNNTRWVMLLSINPGGPNGGSATQYFLGDFDGKTFTLDPEFAKGLGMEPAYAPEGTALTGFETDTYGDWTAEGTAFGDGPAPGTLPNQSEVTGYRGEGLVNSFRGGDAATGKLTSPEFTIQQPYINFLIGGGNDPRKTCMHLLVDDAVVRTAAGSNSERLQWHSWDVRNLAGKRARLQIVDDHTDGWGHISVDQILFAAEPATPAVEKAYWADYGKDNYAGVTWSDIPQADGRRIFIGWMSNWQYANVVPTERWRSAMTVARVLTLTETEAGVRLHTRPVKELANIYGNTHQLDTETAVEGNFDLSENLSYRGTTFRLELDLQPAGTPTRTLGLELSNAAGERLRIGYEPGTNRYYVDRRAAGQTAFSPNFAQEVHYAPRKTDGNGLRCTLLVDRSSVELFTDDGLTVLTELFFPTEDFGQLTLYSEGGKGIVRSATLTELKSIWR